MTFPFRRALVVCLLAVQLWATVGGAAHHAPAANEVGRTADDGASLWNDAPTSTTNESDCPICAFLALSFLTAEAPVLETAAAESRPIEQSNECSISVPRPGPPCRAPPLSLSRS